MLLRAEEHVTLPARGALEPSVAASLCGGAADIRAALAPELLVVGLMYPGSDAGRGPVRRALPVLGDIGVASGLPRFHRGQARPTRLRCGDYGPLTR